MPRDHHTQGLLCSGTAAPALLRECWWPRTHSSSELGGCGGMLCQTKGLTPLKSFLVVSPLAAVLSWRYAEMQMDIRAERGRMDLGEHP